MRSENFRLTGNYADALKDLMIVLDEENKNQLSNKKKYALADIHFRIGKLHEDFGKIDDAITEFNTVASIPLNKSDIERSLLLETIGRKVDLLNKSIQLNQLN